ncbi:hypothetical protein HK100_010478 [Physocladia obscura]|uniref:AB hydrolase-1 domain-containing protein n=1 Tax=Physocladia obscura TaxID=109957 RepID=A0AAD5T9S1_9FUNG|nr:hypothetical protein HK100_010478 [Physocladia obscura]
MMTNIYSQKRIEMFDNNATIAAFTTLAIAVCNVAAVLALVYVLVVPADNGSLGSLGTQTDSTAAEALDIAYPLGERDRFANLSRGPTHYFLSGNPEGKKLVFVHGINLTGNVFPHFIEALTAENFLVLAYDLYGMGYSDSPGVGLIFAKGADYDHETYTTQLLELLDHVEWTDAVVILGFSLGGGISTHFADKYPTRVEKLILVAPAGLKHSIPPAGRIFYIPFFGALIFYLIGMHILSQRSKKHLQGAIPEPYKSHFVATQNLNFRHNPGFPRCYIKTVKNGPIRGRDQVFKRVGVEFGDRVLCFWGESDMTCVFGVEGTRFREYMPNAMFETMQGRHTILGEKPNKIAHRITSFVQ